MINRGKILIIPHTRLAIAFPLVCCGAMGTAPGGGGTVAELSRTGEVDFPQFEQNGLLSAMDAPQFGQSKVFPLITAKASYKLPETYSGAQRQSSCGVGTTILSEICRDPGLTSLCENASYAPLELSHFALAPRASALGCILVPLRGWELRFACHLWFGV